MPKDEVMRVFSATDLQRNSSEIQRAALVQPVLLSYYNSPRYVIMSVEEYMRLKGSSPVATAESFSESVLIGIRQISKDIDLLP